MTDQLLKRNKILTKILLLGPIVMTPIMVNVLDNDISPLTKNKLNLRTAP